MLNINDKVLYTKIDATGFFRPHNQLGKIKRINQLNKPYIYIVIFDYDKLEIVEWPCKKEELTKVKL